MASRIGRRAGWVVSLVIVAVLAACIDSGGDGADDVGGGDGVAPAPDLGGGDNGNEAPASPLDIPDITIAQGQLLEKIQAELEADLAEQCGGTLCVTVRVEQGDSDTFTVCEFDTTVPPLGSQIERGGELVILTGTAPCETPSPSAEP